MYDTGDAKLTYNMFGYMGLNHTTEGSQTYDFACSSTVRATWLSDDLKSNLKQANTHDLCKREVYTVRTLGTVVAREIPAWEILKVVRSIRAGFSLFASLLLSFIFVVT